MKKALKIIFLSLLLLTAALFLTKSGMAERFRENIRIDDSGSDVGSQNYPSLTVDKNDIIYTVWYGYWYDREDNNTKKNSIFFSKSIDGGKTFTEKISVNKDIVPSEFCHPSISVNNKNGNMYVVWHGNKIYCAKSTDSGKSFGEAVPISNDYGFNPIITVGRSGLWDKIIPRPTPKFHNPPP